MYVCISCRVVPVVTIDDPAHVVRALTFTRYSFSSMPSYKNQYYYSQTPPSFGHPTRPLHAHAIAHYSAPPRPSSIAIHAIHITLFKNRRRSLACLFLNSVHTYWQWQYRVTAKTRGWCALSSVERECKYIYMIMYKLRPAATRHLAP